MKGFMALMMFKMGLMLLMMKVLGSMLLMIGKGLIM